MKSQSGKKWDVESMKEVANKLNEVLSEDIVPLSSEERKRFATARFGFERYAKRLADAAEEHGLAIKRHDLGEMLEAIRFTEDLSTVEAKIATAWQRVNDLIAAERSGAYKTFLAYYHALEAIAGDEIDVQNALEPIVDFLTTQKRPAKSANADEEEKTPQPGDTPAAPVTNVTPLKVPA